ncbi:MAG: cytochrome c family protein [Rhodobiaceae bacterium]|nr:cytochrome c family protein [Rhodobiaceae bacterium]MCC0055125.1 cytochrome c family protein [Rhodobiaceae bacterium]
MDSFEFNKIAGAVLFTVLVVLGIGVLADGIFDVEKPEKPGYAIAVAEAGAAGDSAGKEAAAETPLPVLLASASAEKGADVAKKCASCHSFEQGGPNKVGPDLYNVVGRVKGSHEGFKYSSAMEEHHAAGETWTLEDLNHFIRDPKGTIPGTAMGFAGLKKDGERADMLMYLRSLSDNPVPLPQPEAAAPAASESAPAASASSESTPAPAQGESTNQEGATPAPTSSEQQPAAPQQEMKPQEEQKPQQ